MLNMWNPFDNVLEQMWNDVEMMPHVASVPTNVKETADSYIMEMAMPGMEHKNVKLRIRNGYLCLRVHKGHRFSWPWQRNHTYIRDERRLQLPANVDGKHVSAKMANGILRVTLPKKESYIGGSVRTNNDQQKQIKVA